jgi:uncharacterized protein
MRTDVRRTADLLRAVAVVLAVAALAGCGLSRAATPTQHFVLGGALLPSAEAAAGSERLAVGVRRLQVAPYLLPTGLVVRRGADEVTYSEFHRWGEPLGDGIGRAVAGYLTAGGAVGRAEVAPWAIRAHHDYLVQLHVLRFEGVTSVTPPGAEPAAGAIGEAQVVVTWELLRPADGAVVARGRTEHREPGWRVGDYPQLAALLDRGVQALAAGLSARLAGLPRTSAP